MSNGVETRTITAAVAKEMLRHYHLDWCRPSHQGWIDKFAHIIVDGAWILTDDPIYQFPDGRYGNGRLRLLALIQAQKIIDNIPGDFQTIEIEMMVVQRNSAELDPPMSWLDKPVPPQFGLGHKETTD